MKSFCATGLNRMHDIIERASGDIQRRLWTLYWLTRMTRKTGYIVELGVRQGDSTRAILAACVDCDSILHSFDIEDCSNIDLHSSFRDRWLFEKFDSVSAAATCGITGSEAIDLVFVDTDHTVETTTAEIAAWSPCVRVGGAMAFHDYWLNDGPGRDGVKKAVDAFADSHSARWAVETHDAYQDPGFAILWRFA